MRKPLVDYFIPYIDLLLVEGNQLENITLNSNGSYFITLHNLIDNILVGITHHLTKYSMFTVEPGSGDMGNEKLATVALWSGIGHRQEHPVYCDAVLSQTHPEIYTPARRDRLLRGSRPES